MKASTKSKNILLALFAAALLSACAGKNEAGSTDSSSRIQDTTATTSTTKPLAYCNQGVGTEITAKLKAYTDSSNVVRMNYLYVRMTTVPSNFQEDSSYISMWKWLSNTSGYTYLDSTALQFILINASTGQAITGWKNTLHWSEVSAMATSMGATDPQSFFNKVTILVDLKDTNGDYDVLKITNYDIKTNVSLSATDSLIPLFHANPADYAVESSGVARAQVLQGLHPFKSYANQGLTADQFASMANNFCF